MEKIRNTPADIQVPVPSHPEETPQGPSKENLQKYFQNMPDLAANDPSTGFHRGSRSGGVGYGLVAWSFMAASIDALVLISMGCLVLFVFSFLVKVQFFQVTEVFGASSLQLGVIFAGALVFIYMIMLRVFLGFSIGEWACGLRLGSLKQRLNSSYSLRVLARVFLIFATGLVVLPALSLLLGRDLPGLIVRLPLVSLTPIKK